MLLRLPTIIQKVNPTLQGHGLSPALEKTWFTRNLWSHSLTHSLTHSVCSLSLSHKSRPNLQERQQPAKNTRQSKAWWYWDWVYIKPPSAIQHRLPFCCNSKQAFRAVCICTTKFSPDFGDRETLPNGSLFWTDVAGHHRRFYQSTHKT
jgi:hypothetical protein